MKTRALRTIRTLFFLALLGCALRPSPVHAHPADMYAQDQFITLTRAGLQLDWKILPGPFLADAVWSAADTDHSGTISTDEAQAWVAPFLSDFSITLDGQRLNAIHVDSIRWPGTVDVLRTGEDAVEVRLSVDWPSGLTAEHLLAVHNAHLESNTLNWFSLSASNGLAFNRPGQENGRLTLDLFFAAGSLPGSALTSWTSGTPNLPDFTASFSSLLNAQLPARAVGAGSSSDIVNPAPQPATSAAAALTSLVRNVQASPLFLLTAFLLSLALGSLHALTPGHGKALVGAYLVGSQGRTRDAVLLGGIVTLTHTGSVLLLGMLTLVASHYILPALIVPWLELLSGVLVILFGLNLLFQRRRDFTFLRAHPDRHDGHEHVHPHDHLHPHASIQHTSGPGGNVLSAASRPEDQADLHIQPLTRASRSRIFAPLSSSVDSRSTDLPVSRSTNLHSPGQGSSVSPRSLLALGISGGLVPCPDAIAILLVAVALNRVPFGMLLIVAFSIGLAAVLIGIGIAMVHGFRLLSRSDWLNRFSIYAPIASALVVTALGAGLTFNAWTSFKFSQAVTTASPTASAYGLARNVVGVQPSLLYIAPDSSGNDQLFLLSKAGSSPAQLTREPAGVTGYSVSPDGTIILYSVFQQDGSSSIWSIHADGTGRRLAVDCPQAECNSAAWYPDGSRVAYERLENTADAVTIPRFSIWWLDLQSGKTQPVFQDAAFASTAPQFSPDGQWLSYISAASNTLVAYNLKNTRTLSVPLGSQSSIPETWSPKGDALLFGNSSTSDPSAPNGSAGLLRVKVYSLATGRITDLGGQPGDTDYSAVWSPDGQWIAIDRGVTGTTPGSNSNQVWLVKPDGSQAHVLLNEGGASYSGLGWSPDGRLLLYSRYKLDYSNGGTGQFNVCSTDITSGQTAIVAPGGDVATFLP